MIGTSLTSREEQVIALVARGLSNREIAAVLTVSEHTVRSHLRNICRRLGATDRVHAVALWASGDLRDDLVVTLLDRARSHARLGRVA